MAALQASSLLRHALALSQEPLIDTLGRVDLPVNLAAEIALGRTPVQRPAVEPPDPVFSAYKQFADSVAKCGLALAGTSAPFSPDYAALWFVEFFVLDSTSRAVRTGSIAAKLAELALRQLLRIVQVAPVDKYKALAERAAIRAVRGPAAFQRHGQEERR